jgi:AAA+ superfamily predicted ATPase
VADDALIASLETAVAAAPADPTLRLHLADLLVTAGRAGDAVAHLAVVLQQDPGSARARELMGTALAPPAESPPIESPPIESPPIESRTGHVAGATPPAFDWSAAESEVGDVLPPMFTETEDSAGDHGYDVEVSGLRLSDVGGMKEVKKRLQAAFLAPMRNPELGRLYGKSLRGGLLLYGPPGCGKTFLARALAGELGAHFLTVTLSDVLDKFVGQSEKNVHELFQTARRTAPCVVFLDEVDALGHKRSGLNHSGVRTAVNQLLTELDGVREENEGVFVLAASNQPWDVDPAMRRPGRLDRTLLVLPPDSEAREAIFRHHLEERPVERIDVRKLAKLTDGYSGADIAHVCETGAERALMDSVESGTVRMIGMPDLLAAVAEVRPSLSGWFDTARNVALFANEGGMYDELVTYLRKRHLL